MDDILVATPDDIQRHREIIKAVLKVMRKEFFFLKISKCEFEQSKVKYLGLIVDRNTIKPDPSKVARLKDWPQTLKSVKKVRSTLGLLNYHRAFVPGFPHIIKPLTTLLKKGNPFLWTAKCKEALDRIIHILTNKLVLAQPNQTKPFELEVDVSNYATGAILFQRDKRGKPKPNSFHSKTFSKKEMNYNIYDKELTAMDWELETWQHLLLGRPTIIHMDHRNLTYYRQSQRLSHRARQAVTRIMQYDIFIKHKSGILNKADALSRRPDHPQDNDDKTEVAFPLSMFINETTTTNILPAIITEQANNPNYSTSSISLKRSHLNTKTTSGSTNNKSLFWRTTTLDKEWFPITTIQLPPDTLAKNELNSLYRTTTGGLPSKKTSKPTFKGVQSVNQPNQEQINKKSPTPQYCLNTPTLRSERSQWTSLLNYPKAKEMTLFLPSLTTIVLKQPHYSPAKKPSWLKE